MQGSQALLTSSTTSPRRTCTPRVECAGGEVSDGQVLAEIATLDRPAFGPEFGKRLLPDQENGLVRVAVGFFSAPPVEITVYTLRGDGESRHRSLGKSPRPPFSRLEAELHDTAVHDARPPRW